MTTTPGGNQELYIFFLDDYFCVMITYWQQFG